MYVQTMDNVFATDHTPLSSIGLASVIHDYCLHLTTTTSAMAVSRLNKAADTRRDGRYYALLTNLQAVVISNVVLARLQTRRAIIFNRVCLPVCL